MTQSNSKVDLRDKLFYLDDTFTIFKVEDTLFRVPRRQFLLNSPTFNDMFACPAVPNKEPEGSNDANPIVLPDSKKDFIALMKCFYVDIAGSPSTSDEWTSILHLAHKYQMEGLSTRATKKLSSSFSLPPMTKYNLATRYNLPKSWTEEAFGELCQAEAGLTLDDATVLGLQLVMAIGRVREHRLSVSPSSSTPGSKVVKSSLSGYLTVARMAAMVDNIVAGRGLHYGQKGEKPTMMVSDSEDEVMLAPRKHSTSTSKRKRV